MLMAKRLITGLLLILWIVVAYSAIAGAQASNVTDKTVVKKGQNYSVDGTINGDLFCFGQDVTITATVNGDVICAGHSLTILGVINGSARFASNKLSVNGQISGNTSLAANSVSINKSAKLGGDLHAADSQITVDGSVGRDFSAVARSVTINGNIGRDVNVKNANLNIASSASIGGSVYNNSTKPAIIANQASTGDISNYNTNKSKFVSAAKGFLVDHVYWFVSLIIISFAVLWLFPRPLVSAVRLANNTPIRVLATGLVTIFVTPIVLVLLALTVVGIPLALLLFLIYIVVIFMSGPFFAFIVGSKFLPEQSLWVKMLLGSSIVLIAYSLPLAGFLVALVATVFGSGVFVSLIVSRLPHAKQQKSTKT